MIPQDHEKLMFVLASDLQLLRALESPKWRLYLLHTGVAAVTQELQDVAELHRPMYVTLRRGVMVCHL